MKKLIENFNKRPVLSIAICFAVLSLIFNIVWILLFDMAHIYDIIHVFPVIFIYQPIIDMIGGYVTTEFIFLPLAVIMDFLIGLIVGRIMRIFIKTETLFLIGSVIAFAIYWIVVTYQWLPIL